MMTRILSRLNSLLSSIHNSHHIHQLKSFHAKVPLPTPGITSKHRMSKSHNNGSIWIIPATVSTAWKRKGLKIPFALSGDHVFWGFVDLWPDFAVEPRTRVVIGICGLCDFDGETLRNGNVIRKQSKCCLIKALKHHPTNDMPEINPLRSGSWELLTPIFSQQSLKPDVAQLPTLDGASQFGFLERRRDNG